MNGRFNRFIERYAAPGLFLIAVLILFIRLGDYPLQMQWEPNYGQVVREMILGEGDAITPVCKVGSDEGAAPGTFWSKPILIFWAAYPFAKIFGVSEWTLRAPIALTGLLVVFLTFWIFRRLYNRRVGLLTAGILATIPAYYLISRAYMVDQLFVGFMWVGVGFLLLGEKERRDLWYYLFYIFLGISSLAKGLTPLVLTGGTIFFYCLVTMDWGILKRMRLFRGALIFLVVAAPWYSYMTAKYGMPYLKKFFWDHHVERSLGKLDKPNDTFEMFVLYFSIGLLPWLVFLPQAIVTLIPWRERLSKKVRFEVFLLTGFLFGFAFFSIISTKFVHYIFPTVPYAAAILALYLDRLFTADREGGLNRMAFFIALLTLGIVAPDLLDMKNYRTIFYFITTERLQDWHPAVADPTRFFTVIYILFGLALFVSMLFRRFNRWIFGVLLLLSVAYALYINMHMIPTLTEMFSARGLVRTYLETRANPDEPLGEFTQTWKSRSIKYHMPFNELKDTYHYRQYRIYNNIQSVKRFYERYKGRRVFIIIEQKQKHFKHLNAMWQEVANGEQLMKIADDRVPGEPYRPEFWLVSNRDTKGQIKILSPEDIAGKTKEYVRTEPFHPEKPLSVMFDKDIRLVGHSVIPESHPAGKELPLTLYFQCVNKPTRDFKVFVHVEKEKIFRLRGDHTPVDGLYPVSKWKPGEYIKDTYKIDVPPDTRGGHLDIFVGLYQGNYRARVPDIPQRDNEGRLKLGTVEIVN